MYKGLLPVVLARGTSAFGVLLFTWLVTVRFNAHESGHILLFTTYTLGLSIIGRFGLDVLLLRDVAARALADHLLAHYLRANMVALLACFSVVTLLVLPMVTGLTQFTATTLCAMGLCALCFSLMASSSALLKAQSRPVWGGFLEGTVVFLLASLFLVAMPFEVQPFIVTFAAITLAASLLSCLHSRLLQHIVFPASCSTEPQSDNPGYSRLIGHGVPDPGLTETCKPLTRGAVRHQIGASYRFGLMSTAAFVSQWGSVVLMGTYTSSIEVAQITVILRLLAPLHFIQLTLDNYLAPRLANAADYTELRELRRSGIISAGILALPLVASVWFLALPILNLFPNIASPETAMALRIIVTGYFLLMLLGCNGMMLAMRGAEQIALWLTICRAMVLLVFGTWLTSQYGVIGACIGYLLAMGIQLTGARVAIDRMIGR